MSTKKIERRTTTAEAAQILLSAVSYCQKSGVKVLVRSVQGRLVLHFDGLEMVQTGTDVKFVPAAKLDAMVQNTQVA